MSAKFLLSPSEVPLHEKLGDDSIVSSLPEEHGADILIYTPMGLFGVQRKECPHDFLSSFEDGRLTRGISLLKSTCKFARVLGEGHFEYMHDGTVNLGYYKPRDGSKGARIGTRFTRKTIYGMINDIELVHGIQIDWVDDMDDTVIYLQQLRHFMEHPKHVGLYSRPSAVGLWDVPTNRDIDLWILQSWPGVGPSTAEAILNHFGGTMPLMWTCTLEELMKIKNVTAKKAQTMWETLPTIAPIALQVDLKRSVVKKQKKASIVVEVHTVQVIDFGSLRDKLKRNR